MSVVTLDTAEASVGTRRRKADVLPHALPLCKHLNARDNLVQRLRVKLAWVWLPRLFVQVLRPHYHGDPLHLLLDSNLRALVGQPVERGHILHKSDMSYKLCLKGQDLSNQKNPRASTFSCLFFHPRGVPQREGAEEVWPPGLNPEALLVEPQEPRPQTTPGECLSVGEKKNTDWVHMPEKDSP